MCKTCNGSGGIVVDNSWSVSILPCPDSHCDFDRSLAWQKTLIEIEQKRREITAIV